jgi:hypothetical protein
MKVLFIYLLFFFHRISYLKGEKLMLKSKYDSIIRLSTLRLQRILRVFFFGGVYGLILKKKKRN